MPRGRERIVLCLKKSDKKLYYQESTDSWTENRVVATQYSNQQKIRDMCFRFKCLKEPY